MGTVTMAMNTPETPKRPGEGQNHNGQHVSIWLLRADTDLILAPN